MDFINDSEQLLLNMPKTLNTYLGQKGYTILKNELNIEQQYLIRKELTVKPFTPGQNIGIKDAANISFPAYRESSAKMYVPRYFGESLFGPAKVSKISEGVDISLKFNGAIRPNQELAINAYLAHIINSGGGLLDLPCGAGKTVNALKIISVLQKKTIIIVHKEFLMNQWIERISQFMPETRVGKIQGQIIDIDNKDIVLCMLQSLSMKDYPAELFESFGLTVIDEVHHIGSEVFSRALFKLVTKYTLGLSATMNRKDGTTKIFKMFLGDVVYSAERAKGDGVVVRGIEYITSDEEFNEVSYDFRGNPAYSTMISKLCAYNSRTEFILKVIQDMLKEDDKQQIMVIAHNKCVLKYMHDAINHRNIATCGYYVGGMKESALKESSSKQILICTYSMASEGLDVPTLTTLVMVTPKTDIVQTVGRILRAKHSTPIVVDIIDSHQPFKNQWAKRLSFYKKQDYKVVNCDSTKYGKVPIINWKITYDPSKPKKIKKGYKKDEELEETDDDDEHDDEDMCENFDNACKDLSETLRKKTENKKDFMPGKCLLRIKK